MDPETDWTRKPDDSEDFRQTDIRSGLGQSDLRARKVRARGLMSHDMLAREHASVG